VLHEEEKIMSTTGRIQNQCEAPSDPVTKKDPSLQPKTIEQTLPKLPDELIDLQTLQAVHPSLFLEQANLLRKRFDAFLAVGFTEDQAMQLILRWGLKKNLVTD
jgi:hypothetical protein